MSKFFSIKTAIGFGIGVGANILTRFAVCIYFRKKNLFLFSLFLVKIFNKNLWTYFN